MSHVTEKTRLLSLDSTSQLPSQEPSCAVVVASFRPGPLIYRCLHSLLIQEGVSPPEIIVVDSSADGTAKRLQQEFPMISVIELERQTPQSQARNIGIARTQAQFIAITDHDCVVPPDWLQRLLAWHAQGHYEAVGGAVGNGTPDSAVGTASYLIEFNEFLPTGTPQPVEMIPHCNICFRREVFTKIGLFIESPPGAEDLLYNFLIRQRGGQIFFDPHIVVTHLNRTGLRTFLRHQRLLGFGSAVARRMAPLKGQVFVRHAMLAYGLPLLRLVRTTERLFSHNRTVLPQYLRLLPLIIPGYIRWTAGFLAGLRHTLPHPPVDTASPLISRATTDATTATHAS